MAAAGALALGTASAVVLWVLLSRLAGLAAAPVLALLAPLPAAARARWLLFFAGYPLLLAPLLALLVFHVEASAFVVATHCHHGSGCAAHAPLLALPDAAVAWLGAVGAGVIALLAGGGALALNRCAALGETLACLAGTGETAGWRVLESALPEARCVGLWRPTVLVSRGLLACAPAAELEVHLLHAHARRLRRDDLRALLARLAMAAWPARARRRVLEAFALAAAASCDAAVVQAVGSTAAVARALAAQQRRMPAGATRTALARRRAALAGAGDERRPLLARRVLVGALGALPLGVLPGLLHQFVEHVLPRV